jgi:hypothetical protein
VFRQSCRLEHQPIVEGLNGLDNREIVGLRQIAGDLLGITAKPRQNCKIKVLKLFAELVKQVRRASEGGRLCKSYQSFQ